MEGLGDAIEALVQLGRDRTFQRVDDGPAPAILVPAGTALVSLEDRLATPVRVREDQKFIDADSFAGYVGRFKTPQTVLVASVSALTLTAHIDYHGDDGLPSWNTHKARLVSIPSPDWKVWTGSNEKAMAQVPFAEFLEDQNHCIVEPDAATMVEIALNLQSKTDVTFQSKINISNGLATLMYAETAASGVESMAFPTKLHICVPPFQGSKPVDLLVRMRYRINGGNPTIFYKLDRPDRVVEESLRAEWEKAGKALELPVLVGP